ncbi:MAG: SDR family oxidoreductase [Chlorobiaceae bacterium]|nr:SDR family oxidoreductase [Chlorobiaceae bacterium]
MSISERKVCFVTGASGKLGSEIALALAGMGYSIFFTWHHAEEKAGMTLEKIRRVSPESQMVRCNISNVSEINQAFETFSSQFERIDLFLAGASNFYRTPLFEVTEKEWDSLLNTNLKGTFFTMQSAARIMLQQPFISRIITMTDISAGLVWRNYSPYTVSKSAVQHLTKIFARECAPKILVNSIAPGTISAYPDSSEEPENNLTEKIPLRRFGDPEDILVAIRFLMESEYITGQTINIDGGRTVY